MRPILDEVEIEEPASGATGAVAIDKPAPDATDDPDDHESEELEASSHSESARTWFVSIPKLAPLAGAGPCPEAMQRLAADKRTVKFPFVRSFCRSALDKNRQPLPAGLVPLGVFLRATEDRGSWRRFALLVAGGDEQALGKECPWGPLFVTGFPKRSWMNVLENKQQIHTARELFGWLGGPGEAVVAKVQRLHTNRCFAIGFLHPSCTVTEAIEAYVRINRAGVRVQPEERALARLSGWSDGIPDLLTYPHRAHLAEGVL